MNRHHFISFCFIALISLNAASQWFPEMSREGDMFGSWGWNRSIYTKSDIHFKGANYDFTLMNVAATDRQTPFKAETYFGLTTITIPQTNLRFGYFLNDHLAITVGVDHMKYVMVQDQKVKFEGSIEDPNYASMVHAGEIALTSDFLTFEHTDGLNYLNAELEYHQGLYRAKNFQLNAFGAAGVGTLMPKSNVKLMGYPRNDQFHLAGIGTAIKVGFELLFWKHFFIRYEGKLGYINMPSIVTRMTSIEDRASQQFYFAAMDGMFGFNFNLKKKPAKTTTE